MLTHHTHLASTSAFCSPVDTTSPEQRQPVPRQERDSVSASTSVCGGQHNTACDCDVPNCPPVPLVAAHNTTVRTRERVRVYLALLLGTVRRDPVAPAAVGLVQHERVVEASWWGLRRALHTPSVVDAHQTARAVVALLAAAMLLLEPANNAVHGATMQYKGQQCMYVLVCV